MKEIEALCRERGSLLIEDCALSLLSETDQKPLGSFGDYSVFCLYKTLPVPNGGLLVQNRNFLRELAELELERCPRTAAAGRAPSWLWKRYGPASNGIGKVLFGIKRAFGQMLRAASVRQVPVGNIGWNVADVNIAMSSISDTVMGGLEYDQIRRRRRDNFLLMQKRLEGRVTMLRNDLNGRRLPAVFPNPGGRQAFGGASSLAARHRRGRILERGRFAGKLHAGADARVSSRARPGTAHSSRRHPVTSGIHRQPGAASGIAACTMIATLSNAHAGSAAADGGDDRRRVGLSRPCGRSGMNFCNRAIRMVSSYLGMALHLVETSGRRPAAFDPRGPLRERTGRRGAVQPAHAQSVQLASGLCAGISGKR